MRRKLRFFTNPPGDWKHHGPHSIELVDIPLMLIPAEEADIRGSTIFVHGGTISYTEQGFVSRFNQTTFHWREAQVKVVRDKEGNLHWVNGDHVLKLI